MTSAVALLLCFAFASAARNCTVQSNIEFISRDVVEENNIASAPACARACEANPACCVGEFEPPKQRGWKPHCFLLSNASFKPNPTVPTSAIVCTPTCGTPGPPPGPPEAGGTRYKHWAEVQGANYVPSYAVNDVKDVFRPGFWNASVVDRELGYAKKLSINSLRVFMSHGAYLSGNSSYQAALLQNYRSFQRMAKAHGLTLMITLGTGERSYGPCNETTAFVQAIVAQELSGTVIAYEADNEPASYVIPYVLNCTLPALYAASKNPNVDISVGLAHVGEVHAVKDMVTTLNWHSYNGQKNGAGLYGEILELQKYVNNKFHPPKQLVVTEWLARPAQPLAAAYPVLRSNGVAGYAWALVIVDCTSHWNRPLAPGDPPFQGMVWPNGTLWDDAEEGECMRTKCATVKYVHHCCNNWHADGSALNRLWSFSTAAGSGNVSQWQTKVFGSPTYQLPGPREGSMRWTNQSGASFTLGPLPAGTNRVALYLPKSPEGAPYTIALDGRQLVAGTTLSESKEWVFREMLSVSGGRVLEVVVGATTDATKFSVVGATFFTSKSQQSGGQHRYS